MKILLGFVALACLFLPLRLFATCSSTTPSLCSISPGVLEVNLGPVPLDKYFQTNSNGQGGPLIPQCSATITVQQCIQNLLNTSNGTGSPSFISQGVTGVRFQFHLGGGMWGSLAGSWNTPFHSDSTHTLDTAWLDNLSAFYADLRNLGITRVSPTPVFGYWSGTMGTTVPGCDGCFAFQTSGNLVFYGWLPFGLTNDANHFPDGQNDNTAYATADANPFFQAWGGWTPFFNLMDEVIRRAQVTTQPFKINDLDIENELDLFEFPVEARLIYDNKHAESGAPGTQDVLFIMRVLMSQRGFDPGRASFSTVAWFPTSNIGPTDALNCNSYFQDKAVLIRTSDYISALYGAASNFGVAPNTRNGAGLPCVPDPPPGPGNMPSLPNSYSEPNVTDIHVYACLAGSSCASETANANNAANTVYSALRDFLQSPVSRQTNFVLFGEVNPRNNGSIPPIWHENRAFENVDGFMNSTLQSFLAGRTGGPTHGGVSSVGRRFKEHLHSSEYHKPALQAVRMRGDLLCDIY